MINKTALIDAGHLLDAYWARQDAENFGPSDEDAEGTDDIDGPSAPDVRGLLVCIHAFEFEDPDTGYLRGVRYGIDYTEPGSWLDRYYGENFVRVDEVVPSDRIPGLPLRDDNE